MLMCLAEALLRIPDAETADRLIRDKMRDADCQRASGRERSMFVNASTWALMLTGRIMQMDSTSERPEGRAEAPGRPLGRAGDPPGRRRRRCGSSAASS